LISEQWACEEVNYHALVHPRPPPKTKKSLLNARLFPLPFAFNCLDPTANITLQLVLQPDNFDHFLDTMAEPQAAKLEAEADDHVKDNDSALGIDDTMSSTTSINSSIMKHREEHGRTYHAYKEGKYLSPNDDAEQDRLDLQHHLFGLTFDGKLFTCPVATEKQIHRVLDVGTGTGIWAIDFGDEHPEAQVLGIDLSPIQPPYLPPNVTFQVDDLEETWTFSTKFDFIYSRMLTASFKDWPRFFQQSFE